MSGDKYQNFEDLRLHEAEGKDFAIRLESLDVPVAVIAPHGGKIEPGTSQIATAIATGKYNLYCFEGCKRSGNCDLHITSTHFDEPRCRELIARCDVNVAVHGLDGKHQGVDVGGLDRALRDQISASLRSAGFEVSVVTSGHHAAVGRSNICNQGRSGAGVQLEITRGLRDALTADEARLGVFARAVQQAIDVNVI